MIAVGFYLSRFSWVKPRRVAQLLVYFLTPSVIGMGLLRMPLTTNHLFLPLIFFILCTGVSVAVFFILKDRLPNEERSVLAYACGSGNTGYFGLPMAVAVLGQDSLALAILCAFGFTFCENTVGYYLLSRGQFSPMHSLRRLLRMPSFYAFNLAIILNYFVGFTLAADSSWLTLLGGLRVVYSVLGMMMIGFGLSALKNIAIEWQQVGFAFFVKFLVWPALVAIVIVFDMNFGGVLTAPERAIMVLMSLVPFPANSVAFSLDLHLPVAQVSMILLLTTIAASILIPIVFAFYL